MQCCSLRTGLLKIQQILACVSTTVLCITEQYIIISRYKMLFIYSPADACLSWSYLLIIMTKTPVSICSPILNVYILISLTYLTRKIFSESLNAFVFNNLKTFVAFFKKRNWIIFTFPLPSALSVPLSTVTVFSLCA